MATIEQCEQQLREKLRSKADVEEFVRDWGGDVATNASWDEATFVKENITRLVYDAHRKKLLDKLGMKLSFPSEAEQDRREAIWTNRRSWIAIAVSLLSLLVAIYAVCKT
jgi:hypothetical protein